MLEDYELDQKVRELILDLLMVMYRYGYEEVRISGLMQMLGVSREVADKHSEDVLILTDEFAKYISDVKEAVATKPKDQPLH
jgi:hypothetical protein